MNFGFGTFDIGSKSLDFQGRLKSKKSNSTGLTLHKLATDLGRFLRTELLQNVQSVDLSANDLFAFDLFFVPSLLEALPNCAIINLSDNHLAFDGDTKLSGVIDTLRSVLSKDRVKRVVITHSRLATVDAIALFNVLSVDLLLKLVFVPSEWINGFTWHKMLSSRADCSAAYWTVLQKRMQPSTASGSSVTVCQPLQVAHLFFAYLCFLRLQIIVVASLAI